MAKKHVAKIARDLTAVMAETVFGWKDVHRYRGELIGKRQDKAGRWRKAKVPAYATDLVHGYAIEHRMKQLGRWACYEKELYRITKTQNLPRDWATPEQRSKAAIKAVENSASGRRIRS
jgi:hypothetical protein